MYQLDAFTQSNPADQVHDKWQGKSECNRLTSHVPGHHQRVQAAAGGQVEEARGAGDTLLHHVHTGRHRLGALGRLSTFSSPLLSRSGLDFQKLI